MAPRPKASSDASSGLYALNGQVAALLEAEMVLATPDEKLRAVGLSFAKIAGIKDLAQKTIDGVVPPYEILHTLGNDEIIERLTQVRGIGRWTVEMLLMFRLGRPRRAAGRRLRRAQWFPARLWPARHADGARAGGISARAGRRFGPSPPGTCGAPSTCIAPANYRHLCCRLASSW